MSDSDRFKHDYHKYADQQVRDRQHGDAMGRLRLAFFVAAVGPGAFGLMHTIGYAPSNMIRYAVQLSDLKSPPGNQLEALAGNLKGWHSIRVNDQWRIIFVWQKDGAGSVKVVDYH